MPGRKFQKGTKMPKESESGILDRFSPVNFGKIVPTSTKKKEEAISCLRPNKGECLDYDISQTVIRMDAGDTKIHLKETKATYVPAPSVVPRKKKHRDESPPYKFINEIWLEKQDRLQEKYRKQLMKNLRQDKIREKFLGTEIHNLMLSMIGPDWFQELSPNQLRTVDQLQCCILTDLKNKTITNVQDNIAKLGLVLRPNHRHIAEALRVCAKSPVEFLLVLYQIMNPKRKEYSLNDRLLLSSVAHLCMTETLRELHVRIPSPPARYSVPKKHPKVKKRIKYDSPYLEPMVFKPVLLKPSGLYENPRIQYPESPYFSYRQTMVIDRNATGDIFELDLSTLEADEAELIEDMRRAQLLYDQIRNGKRVKLLKPTIIKLYEDTETLEYTDEDIPLTLPPLSTIEDSEDEECFCTVPSKEDCSLDNDKENISCECKLNCDCSKKSKIYTKCKACLAREKKKYVQRMIKGVTVTADNEIVPIIEGTVLQKTCDCLQRYKETLTAVKAMNYLRSQKSEFVVGGVAMTKDGPVYVLTTAIKRSREKIVIDPDLSGTLKQREDGEWEKQTESVPEDIKEFKSEVGDTEKKGRETCKCSLSNDYKRSTNTDQVAKWTCGRNKDTPYNQESPCDCNKCTCKEKSKMYTGRKCKKCQEKEIQKYIQRIITGMKETTGHKIVPIIEGTHLLQTCDCLQKYVEQILTGEARKKIQSQKARFIIGGVTFTKDGPVYILSTALLDKKDSDVEIPPFKRRGDSEEKDPSPMEEEEEDLKYSGCKCKQELERFLNHKCTCEECNVRQRHAEGVTFMVGGTICKEDNAPVNIVQGVYEPRCDCLEKYNEKIDQLENYRRRIEVKYNLKSRTLKYSIGGVVNTPDGPVYVITGMRPPVECDCAKAARQREEEEQRLKQMAKMPPTGRIKYQIAGVRKSPDGNVFIISQARAVEDCECDKLYDTYIQAHRACLDIYEGFLKQTDEVLEEYKVQDDQEESRVEIPIGKMVEGAMKPLSESSETHVVAANVYLQNSVSNYNLFSKGEVVRTIQSKCPGQKLNICSHGEVVTSSAETLISQCPCQETDDEDEDESSDEPSVISAKCWEPCPQNIVKTERVLQEAPESVPEKKEPELKRFVILKKLPSDMNKLSRIVKKVLATMAKDGFPLAKLPDCHKLPHFKLWMQMRTGKFWRQKDINFYEMLSKKYWPHAMMCKLKYKLPSVGMSRKMAEKMTWEHAIYLKKIIGSNVGTFYRQISQNTVELAREFFPISYSYEFPNKTFRDVFFAYLPSKEQDTLAFRIVKPHEVREISKKYSCYSC